MSLIIEKSFITSNWSSHNRNLRISIPKNICKHRRKQSSLKAIRRNSYAYSSKNINTAIWIHHQCQTLKNKKYICVVMSHQFDNDSYYMPEGYDSDEYEEIVDLFRDLASGREVKERAERLKERKESNKNADVNKVSKILDKGQILFETTSSTLKGGLQVASDIPSKSMTFIKENLNRILSDLPEGWFRMALWLWERPVIKVGRLTMFLTQLPALGALLITQFGALATQVSLPMLPPLLFGAGILLRSIWKNAGYIFPRLYITIVLLWIIWFLNSLVYKILSYLKRKSTITESTVHVIVNWTECLTLLFSGIVILSMLGVNISAILLPASICIAFAAKDLSHNFLAGFVLFLVQPFKIGDKVCVRPTFGNNSKEWYEGICEKVDLRYTILRKGLYKLHVPNYAFVTREFMVMDKAAPVISQKETSNEKDNAEEMESQKSWLTKEYLRHRSGDDGQLWGRIKNPKFLNKQPQSMMQQENNIDGNGTVPGVIEKNSDNIIISDDNRNNLDAIYTRSSNETQKDLIENQIYPNLPISKNNDLNIIDTFESSEKLYQSLIQYFETEVDEEF